MTFAPSATNSQLCVDVEIIDDSIDEYNEDNLPNTQAELGPKSEA